MDDVRLQVSLDIAVKQMASMVTERSEEIATAIRRKIAALDIPRMVDSYAENYLRAAVEQQVRHAIDQVVAEQVMRFTPDIRDFVNHALNQKAGGS